MSVELNFFQFHPDSSKSTSQFQQVEEPGQNSNQDEEEEASGAPSEAARRQQQQKYSESRPWVWHPGGIKRKSTTPEMDPMNVNLNVNCSVACSSHSQPLIDDFSSPRPSKQRRYEERMSSQLGGIHLSPEHGLRPEQQLPTKQRRRTGPRIEEILDWDDELLDEFSPDDAAVGQAMSAPIVEEPSTTPPEWEEQQKGKKQAKEPSKMTIEELKPNGIQLDDEEEDELVEDEEQRIVLSEELRQLLQRDHRLNGSNSGGHGRHSALQSTSSLPLLSKSQIRTGKELLPYIPSPLARQPMAPGDDDEGPQIQEVQEQEEESEPPDEELLPDAVDEALFSPRVSAPSTPPSRPDDQQQMLDEEEEAMEMD